MTSDNGWLEALAQSIATDCEVGDRKRLTVGAKLHRAEKRYGAGLIPAVASLIGRRKSSLYEWQAVWRFYARPGTSASRILRDMPNLCYSHLRTAMREKDWEGAMDWLDKSSSEGWSAERLGIEYDKKKGKPVPPAPLFDMEGDAGQIWSLVARRLAELGLSRVRVTVREA